MDGTACLASQVRGAVSVAVTAVVTAAVGAHAFQVSGAVSAVAHTVLTAAAHLLLLNPPAEKPCRSQFLAPQH